MSLTPTSAKGPLDQSYSFCGGGGVVALAVSEGSECLAGTAASSHNIISNPK